MARSPDRIFDELLVLKCQDGDEQALKQLVSRWNSSLRRHAWYLTKDDEAATDIVQDAWVAIIRNIRRLRGQAHFEAGRFKSLAINQPIGFAANSVAGSSTRK